MTASSFAVKTATRDDVPELRGMIHALADFEKLSHLCIASEADLAEALFGGHPAAEALIARAGRLSALLQRGELLLVELKRFVVAGGAERTGGCE